MPGWNSRSLVSFVICTLCVVGAFMFSGNRRSVAETGTSSPNPGLRPVLVELFTSEGCSSCPPADEFIEKLDTLQPVAGAQLIVLSEHVDYWDGDGWKDPNSSHALTERQSAYVRALGLSTAYTPQIIVDGTKEARTNDSRELENIFQQAVAAPKNAIHLSSVAFDQANPRELHAHIEADAGQTNADVFLAVALSHVESQVLHGENGGRHLTHVAVVQQITKIGKLQKGKMFAQDARLQLKTAPDPNNVRVIVFAQASGPGKLLGAALWKAAR